LKGFEQVKKIHLIDEEFSVENGLLTPTLKVKRHQVAKQYAADIQALYSESGSNGKEAEKKSIKAKL